MGVLKRRETRTAACVFCLLSKQHLEIRMANNGNLTGKAVLVTGASSGIGAGVALHLASLGCRLCLVARNTQALEETASACRAAGSSQVVTIAADLSKEEAPAQAVNPALLLSKGNIVHISSVTGLRAFPGVVSYNMSKAALDMLTRTAALELADRGVRVNAVNPGVIVTPCHKNSGMSEEDYARFLEHSKTTHAMGRAGTV